jgi:hypothetical protein
MGLQRMPMAKQTHAVQSHGEASRCSRKRMKRMSLQRMPTAKQINGLRHGGRKPVVCLMADG